MLVVDDDNIFRELVCDIIKKEGYRVLEAADGEEGLRVFFENKNIDLVILDVMMPIYDGWEVLLEIREHSEVPVIMLTALGDEKHEVFGLKEGADEYISKPFGYEVFVARINALLRKVKKEKAAEIIIENLRINQGAHKVYVDEDEVDLNRKEFSLLVYLIENRNLVLTREKILDSVWGYDFEGDVRTIDTHIKTLRAKLQQCGAYIKTVRGSGYVFEVNL